MSRAALAFLALAACYRPSEREACTTYCGPNNACPSERSTCQSGYCIAPGEDCSDLPPPPDAAADDGSPLDDTMPIDAMPDVGVPICDVPDLYMDGLTLVEGSQSYTRYDSTSAFASETGEVSYRRAGGPTTSAFTGFSNPRLAPGGKEIFLSAAAGGIYHSTYNLASAWSVPAAVTTGGTIVTFPGTPSATPNRHMVVAISMFLYEGVEGSSGWTFNAMPSFPATQPAEPSLSRDGLRLVYIARDDMDSLIKIWVATRASIGDNFTNPHVVYNWNAGGNEHDPFIDDDCNLYFNVDRALDYVLTP